MGTGGPPPVMPDDGPEGRSSDEVCLHPLDQLSSNTLLQIIKNPNNSCSNNNNIHNNNSNNTELCNLVCVF